MSQVLKSTYTTEPASFGLLTFLQKAPKDSTGASTPPSNWRSAHSALSCDEKQVQTCWSQEQIEPKSLNTIRFKRFQRKPKPKCFFLLSHNQEPSGHMTTPNQLIPRQRVGRKPPRKVVFVQKEGGVDDAALPAESFFSWLSGYESHRSPMNI